MPKISVIIPVYNVEKYLPKCLESVINQTLEDIEIICINDCSTDESIAILKGYATKDKRIKIMDLPQNQGVSLARNIGIEEAKGQYIAFLDPDDWWEPNLAEKVYDKIIEDNSDVVQFAHNRLIDNKISPFRIVNKIQEVLDGKDYKEYYSDFVNVVWDKLYKKDFIKVNGIRFIEKINMSEDVLFSLNVFSKNPKIVFLAECLYNYRTKRDGSVMNNCGNYVSNQIKAFKALLDSDYYNAADDEYKLLCINIIFSGLVYFYLFNRKEQFVLKDFLEIRKLFPYMREKIPVHLLERINEYEYIQSITTVNSKNGVSCLK